MGKVKESSLRRGHREALRKVRVIEAMELPEDLKRAAIRRVMRRLEHRLDRYTRNV